MIEGLKKAVLATLIPSTILHWNSNLRIEKDFYKMIQTNLDVHDIITYIQTYVSGLFLYHIDVLLILSHIYK